MAQSDQKPSEGKLFNTGLISCKQPSVLVLNGSGIAENWRRWKQNFDIYMKASGFNKQSSDIKVAILLNSIGEDAVELYNTFNLSELEREDFDKVIEAFDAYANPRKNVVVERYVFNLRKQAFGETFDTFVTDLKKLVKNCEYGTQMESVIRDRIVLGILDKNLQERLLREADLTLEKAIEVCKASEISRQQAETIQNTTNVCKVTRTPNSLEKKSYNNKNKVANPTPNFKMKGKTNENRYYSSDVYLCKKCNTKHKYAKCPAFGKRCNLCKKENHFAVGCRKNKRNVSELNSDNSADCVVIDTITRGNQMEWNQIIKVGQNKICCKLDSGAQVNLISEKLLRTVSDEIVLKPTSIMLETFGGNKLRPVGLVDLKCTMGEEKLEKIIEFVVVSCKNEVKPILGLDTCVKLGLLSKRDVNVVDISSKEKFIEMNKDIFEGVGKFTNKCSIKIAENCQPVARLPRRVPESLKGKLKEKLDSLEKEKIISRVDNPEDWVSNLVIVEKPDGTIRLCLDPQDLNKAIKREFVLIPTMEELIPKLCNKGCYTVLDLKDGFYQMELDSNSSKLCQFCTPFGVYKFERLPFGIKSAPEIFQKQNLKNFGDIPGVSIYIDDLLVAGETVEEHDKILNQVAERARALNIKFNPKKLQYRMSEVKYLGHVFNKNGIKPDPDQVKAIKSIDTPNNKKELQRILGMINYLRKFIPDMSTITAPLRELLKNNTEFIWLPVHLKALNVLKQMISNSPVLRKFDNNKEIVLQCDSSKDGLGCTLLQEGQPVAFASRGLNDAEKCYAQIEKEFLSIVFATKKFHNYIYGNKVIVHNDHKPLVSIMNKNVANIMSNRLQRMKVKLLKYDLEVRYVPGKWLYVADLLSRSYDTHETDNDEFLNEIVHCVKATKHLQVSKEKLQMFRNATSEDPILKKLVELYIKGWPDKKHDLPENLRYYFKLKDDLFADDGILFLGNKIFVPLKLRSDMLKKLHEGHFGIEKTKSRARQIMYWPGIYNDIENLISKCSVCEKFQPQNCKEPMKQHEIPELPFEKVGMDICEFGGKD